MIPLRDKIVAVVALILVLLSSWLVQVYAIHRGASRGGAISLALTVSFMIIIITAMLMTLPRRRP